MSAAHKPQPRADGDVESGSLLSANRFTFIEASRETPVWQALRDSVFPHVKGKYKTAGALRMALGSNRGEVSPLIEAVNSWHIAFPLTREKWFIEAAVETLVRWEQIPVYLERLQPFSRPFAEWRQMFEVSIDPRSETRAQFLIRMGEQYDSICRRATRDEGARFSESPINKAHARWLALYEFSKIPVSQIEHTRSLSAVKDGIRDAEGCLGIKRAKRTAGRKKK